MTSNLEPPPDTDLLAEQLFAAARQERPAERIKERALENALRPMVPVALSPLRRLLAAAVLAAVAVVVVVLWQTDPSRSPISAEPIAASRVPPEALSPRSETARTAENLPPQADLPSGMPPSPASAAPKARPASLEEELELLDRARQALLSGDTKAALAVLARYEKLATQRHLGTEASLLRIQVLSAAGRTSEASQLATEFVALHPDSPLVDRAKSFAASSAQTEQIRGTNP